MTRLFPWAGHGSGTALSPISLPSPPSDIYPDFFSPFYDSFYFPQMSIMGGQSGFFPCWH